MDRGGLPGGHLSIRENALACLEHYIASGQPMHLSEREWLAAVIGHLTPAEEERLEASLRAAEAREMRRREENKIVHDAAEELWRRLQPPTG